MLKKTRESRKNEMFMEILNHPNATEGEIARGVGLERTPYSRKLLLELVADGSVVRSWDRDRFQPAFVYYVQQTEEMPL